MRVTGPRCLLEGPRFLLRGRCFPNIRKASDTFSFLIGNGRNIVSRVLFRRKELSEIFGLAEIRGVSGERAQQVPLSTWLASITEM